MSILMIFFAAVAVVVWVAIIWANVQAKKSKNKNANENKNVEKKFSIEIGELNESDVNDFKKNKDDDELDDKNDSGKKDDSRGKEILTSKDVVDFEELLLD